MAETTDELREQIEDRRERISATVDQIENRVSPQRVIARRRDRIRVSFVDARDRVMGNDEPDYPQRPQRSNPRVDASVRERVGSAMSDAPNPGEVARRQTKGNPTAAGIISFGFGLLLGSLLPETSQEKRLVEDSTPQLRQAVSEARDAGQQVAEDARSEAEQSAEKLKESASESAQRVKDDGQIAAQQVSDSAQS